MTKDARENGWREITEEDSAPLDVDILLGWYQEWPTREWKCSAGLYGSSKGGWIHGQATHWQPLPQGPSK